jgi:hypothetical protein
MPSTPAAAPTWRSAPSPRDVRLTPGLSQRQARRPIVSVFFQDAQRPLPLRTEVLVLFHQVQGCSFVCSKFCTLVFRSPTERASGAQGLIPDTSPETFLDALVLDAAGSPNKGRRFVRLQRASEHRSRSVSSGQTTLTVYLKSCLLCLFRHQRVPQWSDPLPNLSRSRVR